MTQHNFEPHRDTVAYDKLRTSASLKEQDFRRELNYGSQTPFYKSTDPTMNVAQEWVNLDQIDPVQFDTHFETFLNEDNVDQRLYTNIHIDRLMLESGQLCRHKDQLLYKSTEFVERLNSAIEKKGRTINPLLMVSFATLLNAQLSEEYLSQLIPTSNPSVQGIRLRVSCFHRKFPLSDETVYVGLAMYVLDGTYQTVIHAQDIPATVLKFVDW